MRRPRRRAADHRGDDASRHQRRVRRTAAAAPRAKRSTSCASRWPRSTPRSARRSASSPAPIFGDLDGLLAVPVPPLGWVGDPLPCRPPAILRALAAGWIPVVAPLAVGPLNVNADDAAAALALGLGAKRLVFLTDVAGLYVDDEVVDAIDVGRANAMLAAGAVRRRHRPEAPRRGDRRRQRHRRRDRHARRSSRDARR